MHQYVTGAIIRKLREAKALTQQELAAKLSVSDKTISKWETGIRKAMRRLALRSVGPVSYMPTVTGMDCLNAE